MNEAFLLVLIVVAVFGMVDGSGPGGNEARA